MRVALKAKGGKSSQVTARDIGQIGPARHAQMHQRGQFLPAVPSGKGGPLVGAHEQKKLGLRLLGAQGQHGVDGVAGPAPMQLALVDEHTGQVGEGQLDHGQPIGRWAQRPALVPGLPGRDDAQLVEFELRQGRTRERHMRLVRRIEGPAKQPDAARLAQTQSLAIKKSRSRRPSGVSGGSSRR